MSDEETELYGKNHKKIVFDETDGRHAKLLVKLRADGYRKSEFFKQIVTSYLEGDELLLKYLDSVSPLSKMRLKKSVKLREQGKELMSELGLTESEKQEIFDILARESPELFKVD